MNQKPLTVSMSPHIHDNASVQRVMLDVLIALLPAFGMALYVFGWGAFKTTIIAIVSAVAIEYAIQRFVLKVPTTVSDLSAVVTGLLLAFNLPSHLPWWIIVIGSFVAIAIAKMSFGGVGNNPFNPALVGRVFLLLSFPVAMTTWPAPFVNRATLTDVITTATPLSVLKEGLQNQQTIVSLSGKLPGYMDLFLGHMGGCIGEVSAGALLLGFGYLLYRKVISWHIPVTIFLTVILFSGVLHLIDPQQHIDPLFHLLSGGMMLGAIYMATDMVTSPMTHKGMIIFGVGIGLFTMLIRVFGAYPEGMSFAILMMNAVVPLINRYCKPKRFGEGQ
jgi:electron transport complex protein RnfD